jgi:predicted nucleic-acid-binding Zn-ribbon protein
MPPFSADEPLCAKCGFDAASTEYRATGACCHESREQVVDFSPNERLHRECARCGYQWDEAVITPVEADAS